MAETNHFPANLKKFRQAAGLTQRELARAAGINQESVRQAEGGSGWTKLTTAMALAHGLNVPLEALVGGAAETYRPSYAFGVRLTRLRLESGLTKEKIARQVPVSWRIYELWEQGRLTPSLTHAVGLARALGITVNDLVPPEMMSDGPPDRP